MANEVVKMYRNTGTDETPVWARWYGEIIAEAVKISGENGEPTAQNIKQYVDAKITALLGSSTPETLDTLEEIATWITNHEEVAEALNQAITSKVPNTRKVNGKALSADITLAAEDVGAIPATQKGAASGVASLGADGKVPSTQLPEGLPASGGDADTVNGHTVDADVPAGAKFTDTTYEAATASTLGLVKSGGDVTVNEDGTMSVNDDSHNHTIDNVDGLQDALDGKVPASRKVNGKALSADVTLAAADVGAIPATQKGAASGVASLGVDGKVPSSQLPSSYPASMITEDDTHRFATDAEKTAWNNKADIIFASELPATAPEGAICFLIEDNEE